MAKKTGGFKKTEGTKFTTSIETHLTTLNSSLDTLKAHLDAFQGVSTGVSGTTNEGKPLWNGANACKWMTAALHNYDHDAQISAKVAKVNEKLKTAIKKAKNK